MLKNDLRCRWVLKTGSKCVFIGYKLRFLLGAGASPVCAVHRLPRTIGRIAIESTNNMFEREVLT
jgi:hypothetical protein